ncbi:MAG: hypothetical protein HDT38_06925 [Clostridiales bacterium]|nr:hypothetical protein [Clostridiales bacterium]
MSGALNALRSAVAEQLRRSGVDAVTAMESARANRWRKAVAAVSLTKVVCTPGGFQDYLGVHTDPDTGKKRELYGREMELTLSVDIYAPRDGGERACQQAAEAVAETLVCQGAAGLPVLEMETGRVEFLEQEGLYRQPASCRCKAWLTARIEEGGETFANFEVRGRMR